MDDINFKKLLKQADAGAELVPLDAARLASTARGRLRRRKQTVRYGTLAAAAMISRATALGSGADPGVASGCSPGSEPGTAGVADQAEGPGAGRSGPEVDAAAAGGRTESTVATIARLSRQAITGRVRRGRRCSASSLRARM